MIDLTKEEIAQLLDVATFQRRQAEQALRRHEETEGPMADYNLTAYNTKASDFRSAIKFWGEVEGACMSPRDEKVIRESERFRAYEAVKRGEHYYYGPDCIFCGNFGPTEDDEPCFDPKAMLTRNKARELVHRAIRRANMDYAISAVDVDSLIDGVKNE